jgi:hypothetical protein
MRFEFGNTEPDESDKSVSVEQFDGPHSEPVQREVIVDIFDRSGALLDRQQLRKEFANARIGIQCGIRLKVFGAPQTQSEPGSE